jgi:hypothetical protein
MVEFAITIVLATSDVNTPEGKLWAHNREPDHIS